MTSIFVAKLDFGITSEQLKQAFEDYGTVLKATVATDRETGKSRGFGFVEMADREEALNAINGLDESLMNGRPIAVKEAEQRPDTRAPRDPNAPRPPFKPRESSDQPRPSFRPPSSDDAPAFIPPGTDALKTEQRKKVEKKAKDWGADDNSKKPKMNAHKKSSKNNRFFGDDDDDDFDEDDYKIGSSYDDEEEDDEDDDED